jgi:protoporphyrinogen oxidase
MQDVNNRQVAIIIGAGPAGLTFAYELLTRTNIKPIILEKTEYIGGLSRTMDYKGNKIDIGGHRFFSKSNRVVQWWLKFLPLQEVIDTNLTISYQGKSCKVSGAKNGPNPETEDSVMLIRDRKSRIYFLKTFFDYPISLSVQTLYKLGLLRTIRIGLSYLKSSLFPIKNEKNLEQFFINRFGKELYHTFFKSYTEKVWGMSCEEISAEWGEQRIKGLSLGKSILHVFKKLFKLQNNMSQQKVETSLIEHFLYPKYGPGQMWQMVAEKILEMGGDIITNVDVNGVHAENFQIKSIEAVNVQTGEKRIFSGDYFVSTMPIKELVSAMDGNIPSHIIDISEGLVYRDFITVGLLLNRLKVYEDGSSGRELIKDNWLYIQEQDVLAGRIQIFNNWSPYMVSDPSKVWIGIEYFCNERDEIWNASNENIIRTTVKDLSNINIIDELDVLDTVVIRVPKTYPAYFGSYNRFSELREYLDNFENLFLIGRNGMHKYNNQDHSMLTAMVAVDNIVQGKKDRTNIWLVNTEKSFHETRSEVTDSSNDTGLWENRVSQFHQ